MFRDMFSDDSSRVVSESMHRDKRSQKREQGTKTAIQFITAISGRYGLLHVMGVKIEECYTSLLYLH